MSVIPTKTLSFRIVTDILFLKRKFFKINTKMKLKKPPLFSLKILFSFYVNAMYLYLLFR